MANGNTKLTNALYRNSRDDTFTRITDAQVATDVGGSYGGAWGDYNNDGYLDLFVANDVEQNEQNSYLYQNRGDHTFEKITMGSAATDAGTSRAAAWGDFDRDGWLDLFVANGAEQPDFLYRNNGNGTFTRIATGDPVSDDGDAVSCAWVDYDGDGWLDLLVTNSRGILQYQNEGNSTLTRVLEGELATVDFLQVGLDAGDYDNDGDLDIFFANVRGYLLFRNDGNRTFTSIIDEEIVSFDVIANGCAWGDYDNDGDLDLFVANAPRTEKANFLYENNGDGTFARVTEGPIAPDVVQDGTYGSQGCAWGDYNNDGFLDLFVANYERSPGTTNFLYRNDGNGNSWI